jgi:hypothetical protein
VVATNTDVGFIFQSASTNTFFNAILIGNNTTSGCNIISGSANTFTDSTCTSGVTVNAKDLSGSFFGIAVTDSLNAISPLISTDSGIVPFGSISDFGHFENLFRSWGPHASSSPLSSGNVYACNAGAGYCALWDWRLAAGDTNIKELTANGGSTNAVFTPGSGCPGFLSGSTITADQQTSVNTFLTHATEVIGDTIGDDDGLCESGDTCIYSPNFGAYQGDGILTAQCTFSSGTITGVTIKALPNNGI